MATAEQYADWIVKNKDKKGTPEFETVAEAYKLARSETVAPSVTPQHRSTDTKDQYGRVEGFSTENIIPNAKYLGANAIAEAANIGNNLLEASTFIPRKIESVAASMQPKTLSGLITGKQGNTPLNDLIASTRSASDNLNKQLEGSPGSTIAPLAVDIAATGGVGSVLAPIATAAKLPRLAQSLQTSGISIGGDTAKLASVQGAKNLATRAAGGGVTGATSVAMIDPENIKTGAVIGAALPLVGKAAGEAGKKLGSALSANVAPEVVKLANKAKSLGINIPADRLTNSKPLNAVASSLNYVPFSGRAKTEELFEKQLNTALSKTFGQNTDNVTMGLRKASDDLGKAFDDTLKSNNVRFDKQLLDDIANTQNQAATELSDSSLQIVNRQIDDIIKKGESGVIDGQAAYNIKRTLDRIGRGNNPEAYHARQLKKDLMNGLDRSLGADGAKEFAKVRKQYGTMMDLENIAQNGAEGGISIARLANMKNIKNPELQDLADIAAQFLKPREGQHGAMQRVLVGGLGVGSGIGAPALIGGAVAGRMTNKALNSEMAKKIALGQITAPKVGQSAIGVARTVPIASLYE